MIRCFEKTIKSYNDFINCDKFVKNGRFHKINFVLEKNNLCYVRIIKILNFRLNLQVFLEL